MISCNQKKNTFQDVLVSMTLAMLSLFLLSFHAGSIEASQVKTEDVNTTIDSVKLSLENAFTGERYELALMEQNLQRWEVLKETTVDEIKGYHIQNTTDENLLLISQTQNEILKTALNNNRLAIKSLSDRIEEFDKIGKTVPNWIAQLSDRIFIAEKRMTELTQEKTKGSENQEIYNKLRSLSEILLEKKKRGERFLHDFTELFDKLKTTKSELAETQHKLEERLRSQERTELFKRNLHPIANLRIHSLDQELKTAWDRSGSFLKENFWKQQWVNFERSGAITQTIFLVLFLSAIFARKRIQTFLRSTEQRFESLVMSMRHLALIMLRRSFLLICAAVLLWLYDQLKLPQINYHFAVFFRQTVFILLLTQWGIEYFQHRLSGSDSELQCMVRHRLVGFFRVLRVLIIGFLVIIKLFGPESETTWILRLALETFLFIQVVSFWRIFDKTVTNCVHRGETSPSKALCLSAHGLSYMVFGAALLMDLVGYQNLARHWLVSWAQTFVLSLWANIGWLSIQEWHLSQKLASESQEDGSVPIVAGPVGWLMIQIARLVWLSAVLAGILLAWAGSDFMVEALATLFNLEFSVGSLRVGVKGILLAVVIFYVTHVATRIGRRFLSEKVLDSRDFERGLKDSIVSISSYIGWGLGVLLALGVLGVNATSLAVVFGALSIGIGFGLQNIFNNFISGLILLFERPIQVGDFVEVNGLWAEVKKINVRATVVQTFDNATIIIPNSDFISQQVINWSFKDPSMRRHVDVGVAYGSDIELVRSTLLEIPNSIPQILKYPKPDVLFMDHGDSALIFRLRYWARVDHYFSTSTDVRFALDHRFRELGIEIAFPQRDLHIRSDYTRTMARGTESES